MKLLASLVLSKFKVRFLSYFNSFNPIKILNKTHQKEKKKARITLIQEVLKIQRQ